MGCTHSVEKREDCADVEIFMKSMKKKFKIKGKRVIFTNMQSSDDGVAYTLTFPEKKGDHKIKPFPKRLMDMFRSRDKVIFVNCVNIKTFFKVTLIY